MYKTDSFNVWVGTFIIISLLSQIERSNFSKVIGLKTSYTIIGINEYKTKTRYRKNK